MLRDVYIEQIADEYHGGDVPIEFPIDCWGSGHLPHSMNLRKINGIRLENVQVKRADSLSKDFDSFKWIDIQNGFMNGEALANSGQYNENSDFQPSQR